MKILKKFFLVSLFCSLFLVSVSASVDYYNFDYYADGTSGRYLSMTDEEKKDFINNLESIANFDTSNYKNYYRMLNLNGSLVTLTQVSSDNNFFVVPNYYKSNSSTKNLFIIQNSVNGQFFQTFKFQCDSNLSSCSFSSSSSSSGTYFNFTTSQSDMRLNRWIYKTNQEKFEYLEPPNLGPGYNFTLDFSPINSFSIDNQKTFYLNEEISSNDLIGNFYPSENQIIEPSYSYTSKVLDNGNVELTFSFENYNSTNSPYGFTIENEVSGEEYGEENHFSSIFPKLIPYGDSYSITIPYDTYLYITLAKYNKIEDSSLYFREEIFTDVIDINNIVFSNPSNPYFSIDYQSKNFIQGRFNNTKNNDTCFVKFSNNSSSQQVSCSESFTTNFDFNGFLTFYVKRNNDIIYTRNINILGNKSTDYPYITYNVQKQDFYSVVTFNVINDNYDINMSYRYSLDNGVTWTDYQLIDKEPFSYSINIFSNSNVIFEIANVRSPNNIIVYDSKSVYVVLDISTASGLNSSTDNIIDKFISLISLNDNLINYINLLWNNIKNSKLFLVIMIPFISSIICAIIYLIRRK